MCMCPSFAIICCAAAQRRRTRHTTWLSVCTIQGTNEKPEECHAPDDRGHYDANSPRAARLTEMPLISPDIATSLNVPSFMSQKKIPDTSIIEDNFNRIHECLRRTKTHRFETLAKMPFYEIQHHCPIGPSQRKELAQKLTQLHANAFDTPLMFVNIRFRLMDFDEENLFVGGEPRFRTNQIFVFIRSGPERTSKVFDKLAADIENAWDEVLGGGYRKMFRLSAKRGEEKLPPDERKYGDRQKEEGPKLLQGVFIIPGLTIRQEGFEIPLVGEEKAWLQQNWARFKERENAGDRVIESLLKDAKSRTSLGSKDEIKAEIGQEHKAAWHKGGNNEREEMDHEQKREFERQHNPTSEVVPRP